MVFLISYNRSRGLIESFKAFDDCSKGAAEAARLNLELQLNREGRDLEVVLLEAANEKSLRRTHRRYFETIEQLATTSPI